MTASIKPLLDYYRRFARDLLYDIALFEKDVEFQQSGGSIVYAVDFSEVYGYTQRAAESFFARRPESAFDANLGRATLLELHESILEFILFDAGKNVILLDPYAIELINYYKGLRSGLIENKVRRVARALEASRRARSTPEYMELESIAARVANNGGQLTTAEADRIGNLIEVIAPDIPALWGLDEETDVLERLTDLMSKDRFRFPDKFFGLPCDTNSEVADRWYYKLRKSRGERPDQNFVDAQAMGMLWHLNTRLLSRTQPTVVHLVSRSSAMVSIMQSEIDEGWWDTQGGNVIRHPRGFLTLLNEYADIDMHVPPSRRAASLQRWRRTFERLAGHGSTTVSGRRQLTEEEQVRRQLALITDVWRRYCSVKVAQYSLAHQHDTKEKVLSALAAIHDQAALQNAITDVLSDLQHALDRAHFAVSVLVSPYLTEAKRRQRDGPRRSFREFVQDRSQGSGSAVRLRTVHGSPLPFEIYVTNDRLLGEITEHADDPIRVLQVLVSETLRPKTGPGDGTPTDAEWYLSLAYANAAIGAWELTDRAVRVTLEELEGRDPEGRLALVMSEARYLEGKATRHLNKSLEDLEDCAIALQDVVDHLRESRFADSLPGYELRLVSEKIKILFFMVRKMFEADRSDARINETLDHLSRCHDRVNLDGVGDNDAAARCDFWNNLCYHYMELSDLGLAVVKAAQIGDWLGRFQQSLLDVFGGIDASPDNYVDTLAWVRLRLIQEGEVRVENLSKERLLIFGSLKRLARQHHVGDLDLRDFRRHRDEAQRYFEEEGSRNEVQKTD